MILSLKEVFWEQVPHVNQISMRALTNIKMDEGTLVKEHVLKMFRHLNTLRSLVVRLMLNLKLILSFHHYLTLLISLRSIVV